MADQITKMYEKTSSHFLPEYVQELETPFRDYYGSDILKTEALLIEDTKV